MFELFREHKRKKLVARLLNEQGYRTRNGGEFSDTTIDRLLRDPIAKGNRRANYTRSDDNKKAWELKPESEWVYSEVEPIVSEELWQECNFFLTNQREKLKRTKPVVHLFSGITFCGCGQKMYVPSNMQKYTCNKCRNKIQLDDLEAVFQEQIKNFLISDDEIAHQLEQANETIKEKIELLVVLEKEAVKLGREIERLYDLYQSEMIDKHGFGLKYKLLAERRTQLDEQIPKLQAEIDILKISQLSQENAIEEARNLYERWPSLPFEEKRRIAEAIVEKIIVGDGEIDINLYYTPPPTKLARKENNGTINSIYSPLNRDNLATQPHGFIADTN
jgi:site-specific DNA recombinase